MQAFGVPAEVKPEREWLELFETAVSADGHEDEKICTLHSSSLLAFLFFGGVSPQNTLRIGNSVYDRVFFEIKNKVFPRARAADRPSNVDVVLYSSAERKLLYIESKFTEYLRHANAFASNKYRDAFSRFLTYFKIDIKMDSATRKGRKQPVEGFCMKLSGKRSAEYMTGIKQALSHIIGIATGMPHAAPDGFIRCFNAAPKKAFISIVFEIAEEFPRYQKFYTETIGQLDEERIGAVLAPCGCSIGVDIEDIVSYQKIIRDNPAYKLPEAFRGYYQIS